MPLKADGSKKVVFLRRIGGRWEFAYVREGTVRWWPDHGGAQPKNEIHYLFGPKELLIESRPEFDTPCITDRFLYGSVRQVTAELFDLELRKVSDSAAVEIKRIKLSSDGKTMEIASASDANSNPKPTIQVLERVKSPLSTFPSDEKACEQRAESK